MSVWTRASALAAAVITMTAAVPRADAYCRSTTCIGECTRTANGCKSDGAALYWPGLCVSFSLNEQGSEFVDFEDFERITAASVAAWSDIECGDGYASISFVRKDDVACHKAEYNVDGANANIILFQDTKWRYTGIDNTLAKTTVTYDTDTGEILDADIELNHANNEFTVGDDNVVYDLQSILTHELGHFIGLDHTDDLSATMNPGYGEGSTDLRELEPDDEDAACAVYPPSRNVTCRPEPNGGFTGLCNGDEPEAEESCSLTHASSSDAPRGKQPWLAALVLAAAAVAGRRRRH